MSEESNVVALSADKDGNLENEIMKDNDSKPALQPVEYPFTKNAEIPAEKQQVQENRQPIESAQPDQNNPIHASPKSNEEADSSPTEQQPSTFDASTVIKFLERVAGASNQPAMKSTTSDESAYTKSEERASGNEPSVKSTTSGSTATKSLKRANGNEPSVKSTTFDASTVTKSLEIESGNEPSVKSTTSDGSTDTKSLERTSGNEHSVKSATPDGSTMSLEKASGFDQPAAKSASSEVFPSEVPTSDKGLEEISESIQRIYEGIKDMKISTEDIPVSASGKKGRKPPSTPRARSTPALTSPPLTRSRSRDLRKFPSTPSSPKRSASRNSSEGDSDEMKVRGRQRGKKN